MESTTPTLEDLDLPDGVSDADIFIDSWNVIATTVNDTAIEKGWWDDPEEAVLLRDNIKEAFAHTGIRDQLLSAVEKLADHNDSEMLCLFHSEISECLEGLRHGNPPSEKIPTFSSAEEELADVVIRMMDTALMRGWKLPEAILAKMDYNAGREYKHGGKKF